MIRDAVFSPDRRYRYRLTRTWAPERGRVCWIMLNPSKADAEVDDPTIRRCMTFTERLGRGGLIVVNLFAWRATDPAELLDVRDPGGKDNGYYMLGAIHEADMRVAAWGALHPRMQIVATTLRELADRDGYKLHCLGTVKDGNPRHPLYVHRDAQLIPWPVETLHA